MKKTIICHLPPGRLRAPLPAGHIAAVAQHDRSQSKELYRQGGGKRITKDAEEAGKTEKHTDVLVVTAEEESSPVHVKLVAVETRLSPSHRPARKLNVYLDPRPRHIVERVQSVYTPPYGGAHLYTHLAAILNNLLDGLVTGYLEHTRVLLCY